GLDYLLYSRPAVTKINAESVSLVSRLRTLLGSAAAFTNASACCWRGSRAMRAVAGAQGAVDRDHGAGKATPQQHAARPGGAARAPRTCWGSRLAYSMTSLARPSSDCGTISRSAFAVFRLMISSISEICCTGRSAGFVPLRMRPA